MGRATARAAPAQAASARLRCANRLKFAVFALAAAFLPKLPLAVCYQVAFWISDFARLLTPGRRANVAANLRHVLGEDAKPQDIAACCRDVYHNIAAYYVELLCLPSLDVKRLEREKTQEEGYGYLLEALAEGKGAIVVTAHLGNPDLAIQAALARGLRFFVLTEPIEPPELARLYLQLRGSQGHCFMPVGFAGIKAAVRTLRQGGAVILVADRDIQGNGVEVPFFGAPARMPTGAVELARRSGAPIIPAFSRRLTHGRIAVRVEPRVEMVRTNDRNADLRLNLARVVERFERPIREAPGQWLVLERLWPRRPAPP